MKINQLINILLIVALCYYVEISLFMVECIVNTNLPSRTTSGKPSKPPSTIGQYRLNNRNFLYQSRFNQQQQQGVTTDIDYSNEQINDERRLFHYLMRNYDNTVRPVHNASKPINIRLGITLTQIFDLDEKNQVLTTNVWLDQEWIDEFLTWNITEFGNITKIRIPCQSIWLPDIVLYNNADDYTRGYMNSRAIIEPNGNVFWPPPTKFRSTCQVDVTYFPFDDQSCIMKLGSWIYDGLSVNIENRTQNVDLSNYVSNGEWDLIRTSLVRNVVYYPCCFEPFPDVTITLVIRRKILYYMYNVIVPCIMMSLLTLLVFCLPPESGEKIALGVTVLLAFSVFMLAISEKLPETSESIPLLGVYLTVVMGITSVSIVMTVVVLNFHYCSPLNKRELPQWIKSWIATDQTIFDDYYVARSMYISRAGCHHNFTCSNSEDDQCTMATNTNKMSMGNNINAIGKKIYPNVLSPLDLSLLSTEDSTTGSVLLSKNDQHQSHQKNNLDKQQQRYGQDYYYYPQKQCQDGQHLVYSNQKHNNDNKTSTSNPIKYKHLNKAIQDHENIFYMQGSQVPSISGRSRILINKEMNANNNDCSNGFSSSNNDVNHNRQLLNTIAPIVCAASRLVHGGQMAAFANLNHNNTTNAFRRRPYNHHQRQIINNNHQETDHRSTPPPPPPPLNYSKQDSINRSNDDETNNFDQEMIQILRYLMYRQEVDDNTSRRIHEWRLLSMFIDKILFWIFTITTIVTSVIFLLIIPVKRRGF